MNNFISDKSPFNFATDIHLHGAPNLPDMNAVGAVVLLNYGIPDRSREVDVQNKVQIDALIPLAVPGRADVTITINHMKSSDAARDDVDISLIVVSDGEAPEMGAIGAGHEGVRRETDT